MSEIFYSADGEITKIIENMTNDQYYLDGSLKVSGSVISNKFVNEAGEPIGLPKNVDVKGSLKVRGNTELENTSIKNGLNVNGPVNINKNILKVDEIHIGNVKLTGKNVLKIQNDNGIIEIGAMNKYWGHIYTDRPKFAINKDLVDVKKWPYVNYIKYSADGGIKIQDYNLIPSNNDLLVNNSKTNKVSMTIHRDGSVSLINKLQPTPAQTPVAQTPVAQKPVAQTPVAQTPVAQTPVAQTPVAQTPVAQKKISFFNLEDAAGIKQGKHNNISFETFGLNSNLNNWTITITFSAKYNSSKWQGIIGNMYNSQLLGKIGWGLWINPNKNLHLRIEDWTDNFTSLGQIRENVAYKIIFSFSNDVYKIKLISNDDNNIVIIGKKPKLTTDRGSICLGGRWVNGRTDELFDGNITSVNFTPNLLPESVKKCDRKDISYCIFKDYTTTGNGVCNAPSSTGSGYNYAGLNTYNDKPQFVGWLDALHDRNAGNDPMKGERFNVVDYVNRCKNEPGYSFLNDTKAAKNTKKITNSRIYNNIIKNTDYVGNDISYHVNQTIDSCKKLCDSDAKCAGFLRRDRDNSCWLKTNKVNNPTKYDGLDFYTTADFNPPKIKT